jgi:small subunit ribosomal protein S8
MTNDPIGDMLIQIKNAALARRREVVLPLSKAKRAVAAILKQEGYLASLKDSTRDGMPFLVLELAYADGTPVLTDVKRVSKPGLRRYIGKQDIPRVMGGMGMAILSTPKGVMSGKDAKKQGMGGEFLCEVW